MKQKKDLSVIKIASLIVLFMISAAYLYAGSTKAVGPGGFFLRDENGS